MGSTYYICAYGHAVRVCNDRGKGPTAAAKYCFGVINRVTCLAVDGKGWRYLSRARRLELLTKLQAKHLAETGEHVDI